MSEAYDLAKMLEEIIEDEKSNVSKNRKISQDEIKRLLAERQKSAPAARDPSKLPLGEALVQEGMITKEQIGAALKIQSQKGGKIGSILVELGYITDENLLKFLGRQQGLEGASLLNIEISESLMSLLPSKLILKYRVLPLKLEGRTLSLAMENPHDFAAIHEVEFLAGKRVKPVIIPSYQMDLALKCLEDKGSRVFSGSEIQLALRGPVTIQAILEQFMQSQGSDLLLTAGMPPTMRVHTILKRTAHPPLGADQCVAYAKSFMSERQWEEFLKRKELDFGADYDGVGRFRINAYRQRNTVSLALRRISDKIPKPEALGLPKWIEDIVAKPHGLILVTGPVGHGKTTTVAAMVDMINRSRACNIITLEDPTEYIHKPRKANINQREVGTDTDSFSEGLRRIFRQSPDVVVIGEMRDQETFDIALRASCTGILVLATMHAPNAPAALDNLISYYPDHKQGQVRNQLAESLQMVFSQWLLPRKKQEGMILAYEKLVNSLRMKTFIRDNKLFYVRAQIQTETEDFASLDVSLLRLYKEGEISLETGLNYADNPEVFAKAGAVI